MINRSGIAGVKPYMSGTLILQSGSISISNEDFASGSVVIRGGTSESSEFSVGAAIIGSLTFSLINDSGKFSGLNWFDSRVSIYMYVDNTKVYEGEFYVVQHKEQGNIVSVECHDGLKILDEYQIYEDDITWPADAASVAQKIASRHGMYVSGLSSGIQIDDPGNDQMTERECMSLIAEIQGKYVRALGRAGGTTLSFGWYDMASVGDAGTTFSHDLRTDDVNITGVRVSTSDGSKTVTRGSSGYIISISDNPFITQKNIDSIADRIGSAVIGISYRPGDVTVKSNPSIEPGDVLTVSTAKESGVKIIATTVTYKSSSLTQTITADAEPYSGDLRITRKEYIRKTTQEIIRDDLSIPDSDISSSISSSINNQIKDHDSEISSSISSSVNNEISNQLKDPNSNLSHALGGITSIFLPVGDFEYTNVGSVIGSSGYQSVNFSDCSISQQVVSAPSRSEVERLASLLGVRYDSIYFPIYARASVGSYTGFAILRCAYDDYSIPGDRIQISNGSFFGRSTSADKAVFSSFSTGSRLRRDMANHKETDGWYWG